MNNYLAVTDYFISGKTSESNRNKPPEIKNKTPTTHNLFWKNAALNIFFSNNIKHETGLILINLLLQQFCISSSYNLHQETVIQINTYMSTVEVKAEQANEENTVLQVKKTLEEKNYLAISAYLYFLVVIPWVEQMMSKLKRNAFFSDPLHLKYTSKSSRSPVLTFLAPY